MNFYILIIVNDLDVIYIQYNDNGSREETGGGGRHCMESFQNDNINNFVAESEAGDDNHHFPSYNSSNTPPSPYSLYKCLDIKFSICSKESLELLLIPKRNQQRRLLSNSDVIPYHEKFGDLGYCGFGKLPFDE